MDEDATTRALMIGAGLFIAIITITLVLTYYNSAKKAARTAGYGQDYDIHYRSDIDTLLAKTNDVNAYLSADDVINIINYFQNNQTVKVYLLNLKIIDDSGNISTVNYQATAQAVNLRDDNDISTIIRNLNKSANYSIKVKELSDYKEVTITEQ